jgi:transcription-repair coupling factor (superfamily II helicase)
MGLYRRLADLEETAEIEAFAAELIDRFGPLPEEVQHLLEIVTIKSLCRKANVEKVDAGPKGAVITFRDNIFANPAGLIAWVAREGSLARVRPDQKVVFMRDWESPAKRMKGAAALMIMLAKIAAEGEKRAA